MIRAGHFKRRGTHTGQQWRESMNKFVNILDTLTMPILCISACYLWVHGWYLATFFIDCLILGVIGCMIFRIVWYVFDIIRMLRRS